jgi:hypothetical protein
MKLIQDELYRLTGARTVPRVTRAECSFIRNSMEEGMIPPLECDLEKFKLEKVNKIQKKRVFIILNWQLQ